MRPLGESREMRDDCSRRSQRDSSTVSTTDFTHQERLSRRQAAERLTDVAYALASGSAVALWIDGERVRVPDTDVVLTLELEVRRADPQPRRSRSPAAR
jgi:hypothetical protein